MSSEMCLITTDLSVLTTGTEGLHQRREASEKKIKLLFVFFGQPEVCRVCPNHEPLFRQCIPVTRGPSLYELGYRYLG